MARSASSTLVAVRDNDPALSEVPSRAATRVAALDFVKGALVLIMVLYHWINYFIGLSWPGYRYLRFLTPSFICVTGFLVSHVYLRRYSATDRRLARRLITRGLKLLAIFIALNFVAAATSRTRVHVDLSEPSAALDLVTTIFVSGTARAAFDVLVPIAYFLILTPVFLVASQRLRLSLWVFAVVGVLLACLLDLAGLGNPHLEMLSIALLGLAGGAYDLPRISAPAVWLGALLGYGLNSVALTVWDARYPLQVTAVCVNLALLYVIAVMGNTKAPLYRYVVHLGQYSLLGYIAQILILQFLRAVARTHPLPIVTPLIIATVGTCIVVEITMVVRSRSRAFDGLYRAVFA
jgi:peptidoglycan/LPS O-acetylase OafA/YrhL